jgi:hypothetical protein
MVVMTEVLCLFIYLLNFATYNKQVAGTPQQYTPITVGLLKIAKF